MMGVVVVVGERKKGGEVRKVIVENGSELKNFAVWGGGGGGNGGRRGWGRERNAEGSEMGVVGKDERVRKTLLCTASQ
jgi:hypothetical protein